MKIVLLGYMGAGKSVIGKKLSEKLHYNFYDLDDLIEKETKMSVAEVFLKKGEIYFRKIEHQIFAALISNSEDFVLSLGGGTPCYANNHLLFKNFNVISVFLSATVNTLFERLKNEQHNRPLIKELNHDQLKDFIAKNSFERSYFYHQACYKVVVDDKEIKDIVLEIEEFSA